MDGFTFLKYGILVAEPGFEPGSADYEPAEVPLLYSAIVVKY